MIHPKSQEKIYMTYDQSVSLATEAFPRNGTIDEIKVIVKKIEQKNRGKDTPESRRDVLIKWLCLATVIGGGVSESFL